MSNIPVALVTGGSRGIGRAAAEELAREGYKVALIARTPERLEAAARELVETLGLDAEHAPLTFALDVGDGQAVGDAVDRLAAEWGRIDVLFNSAGVSIPGTLELDADTLDLLYRTNLRAPFLFMKHVIPIMRRQGSGYIFNLASRNGKIGVAGARRVYGLQVRARGARGSALPGTRRAGDQGHDTVPRLGEYRHGLRARAASIPRKK